VAGRHASGAVGRARYLRREMTRPEQKLWALLRKRKLNVRRQAPMGPYIVDFVSHAARLVIELDGPLHETPDVNLRDAERTEWLRSQGYRVLRFPNAYVLGDPIGVADQIEAAIKGKALPLDGGGLGGGVAAEMPEWVRSAPNEPFSAKPARTPPTPALPPSRGKGEDG
jgi:very-short-patch-repair endonuclease